jgi:hypothetical protein
VQYVLENSLRESGDHLRLTAQLIQVKDQTRLWSQDYDYLAKDTLNVEDEVAKAVAREIRVRLTSQQQEDLARSQHYALARIPTGINHIVRAVAVHIRNGHRRRARRVLQGMAVEMELAIIQADIARHFPIGNRDIRIAVAVQVANRRVSC